MVHLSRHSLGNTPADGAEPSRIVTEKPSDHDVIRGGRRTPRPRRGMRLDTLELIGAKSWQEDADSVQFLRRHSFPGKKYWLREKESGGL